MNTKKKYEIKNINIVSLVKILLPIYGIVGAVSGGIIFFLTPHLSIIEKFVVWITFMIVYPLIIAGTTALIA